MSKKGNWWVKDKLLTSGLDTAGELSGAGKFFPSEYTPMVFMTGDGHRLPPFAWTTRGVWPKFFAEVVKINKLCCHVEKYSNQVTKEDVPAGLAAVFARGKVFGWELDIWKDLQVIMDECFRQMSLSSLPLKDLKALKDKMWNVSAAGYLKPEAEEALQFYMAANITEKDPVPMNDMKGYEGFLGNYAGTRAMKLRTEVHQQVGEKIQGKIKQYSDHMHLITCGDAHINENCADPLYDHVKPPIGTFGIVDSISH